MLSCHASEAHGTVLLKFIVVTAVGLYAGESCIQHLLCLRTPLECSFTFRSKRRATLASTQRMLDYL